MERLIPLGPAPKQRLLPDPLRPSEPALRRLGADFERLRTGLPGDLRGYCLDAYGVDLAGEYAGRRIGNPFGKASGQLSLNTLQVRRDVEVGLGFVVLKTVIAEDAAGEQRMSAWAIPETHMRVERIVTPDGSPGWTVIWKGRGWSGSLDDYLRFFGEAIEVAASAGTVVAASVKYHLPGPGEGDFSGEEYRYTTGRLLEIWSGRGDGPMPLEKDFSPTLAGDDRSREQEQILTWLRRVPALIREGATPPGVCLGVKLMNARFDLDFQTEMVRVLLDEADAKADYLVYANRLFDPQREFEGKVGVAYGGPELSARNLAGLREIVAANLAGRIRSPLPPISGTGDILTGCMAAEYGLLGATSCQLHTLFQLPDSEFAARTRNKSTAALHQLVFHPLNGLLAALLHLSEEEGRPVHWLDLPALGRERLDSDRSDRREK